MATPIRQKPTVYIVFKMHTVVFICIPHILSDVKPPPADETNFLTDDEQSEEEQQLTVQTIDVISTHLACLLLLIFSPLVR